MPYTATCGKKQTSSELLSCYDDRWLQFAADAENEDNVAEQKRQHGKRVRYGEVVQVR